MNASDGGVRVAVDCSLVPGEECQLLMHREVGPSVLTMRVVWSRAASDGWVAGLQHLAVQ